MDINGHPMPQNHPEPTLYIYYTHPQILNAGVIMMIMAHISTSHPTGTPTWSPCH